MILQVIVGAVLAHKLAKVFKKAQDLKDLKAFGELIGYQYIPGESIETYREALIKLRDAENKIYE